MWLHVDAAFSGSACICPEFRYLLDGVELATSFNFNPHKWLLVNFDCSAFWVRDKQALIQALSVLPEYLKNDATASGAVTDFRDWQIPLGRRFRALKLWFVLRSYGVHAIQERIRAHVQWASLFENWLHEDDRFEVVSPRVLSLVVFRAQGSDDFNSRLLQKLNATGKAYLTHTSVNGRFAIRLAVGGFHTRFVHVEALWKLLQELVLLASLSTSG